MDKKIRIGVSSCLLGNPVRYDGGHKHDRFITDILGSYFDFVPVCPEVECGLPIPRETMRLVGDSGNPRLKTSRTGLDHTEQMLSFCTKKVAQQAGTHPDAYFFIHDLPSPSCDYIRLSLHQILSDFYYYSIKRLIAYSCRMNP